MKYIIEIDNLESSLTEREVYNALDDVMLDIADNYGDVFIDVTQEDEE